MFENLALSTDNEAAHLYGHSRISTSFFFVFRHPIFYKRINNAWTAKFTESKGMVYFSVGDSSVSKGRIQDAMFRK